MSTAGLLPTPREQKAAAASTRITFLTLGIAMASIAPLIPIVRERLGLTEKSLGDLLLFSGAGSMSVLPFGGAISARFGCRKVILVMSLTLLLAVAGIASATNNVLLGVALYFFGAGVSLVDVAMNYQAVVVETACKRPMMSGIHGCFSLGGIVGAGYVTLLLSAQMSVILTICILIGTCVGLLLLFSAGMLDSGDKEAKVTITIPRGRVLILGILCAVVFLAEGSVTDWSGVLLNVYRKLPIDKSGIGYVAFAVTMTLGRFTGDSILEKFSPKIVALVGGLIGASGFLLAAHAPVPTLTVVGFGLVGIGVANLVPIIMTGCSQQSIMNSNDAIAAVSLLGYVGFLLGPALVGRVADASSLPWSIFLIGSSIAVVAITLSRITTRAFLP